MCILRILRRLSVLGILRILYRLLALSILRILRILYGLLALSILRILRILYGLLALSLLSILRSFFKTYGLLNRLLSHKLLRIRLRSLRLAGLFRRLGLFRFFNALFEPFSDKYGYHKYYGADTCHNEKSYHSRKPRIPDRENAVKTVIVTDLEPVDKLVSRDRRGHLDTFIQTEGACCNKQNKGYYQEDPEHEQYLSLHIEILFLCYPYTDKYACRRQHNNCGAEHKLKPQGYLAVAHCSRCRSAGNRSYHGYRPCCAYSHGTFNIEGKNILALFKLCHSSKISAFLHLYLSLSKSELNIGIRPARQGDSVTVCYKPVLDPEELDR